MTSTLLYPCCQCLTVNTNARCEAEPFDILVSVETIEDKTRLLIHPICAEREVKRGTVRFIDSEVYALFDQYERYAEETTTSEQAKTLDSMSYLVEKAADQIDYQGHENLKRLHTKAEAAGLRCDNDSKS